MTEKEQQAPEAKTPEKQAHNPHHQEIQQMKEFISTHGKNVIIAVALALIIVSGIKIYQFRTQEQKSEASSLYLGARSVKDLEDVATKFHNTPVAPLAILKHAKILFDSGDYTTALTKYTAFLNDFPEHRLEPGAVLGKAHCQEAMGQLQDAEQAFRAFIKEHPGHFLEAEAVLGLGRCLEQEEKKQEAREVYEEFVAANPDNDWTPNIEEALDLLKNGMGYTPPEASGLPSADDIPTFDLTDLSQKPVEPEPAAIPLSVETTNPPAAKPDISEAPARQPDAKQKTAPVATTNAAPENTITNRSK